jgi:hypothetical protein
MGDDDEKWRMPNSVPDVQVSDTTEDDSSHTAEKNKEPNPKPANEKD